MDIQKILRSAAKFLLSVLDACEAGRPSREDIERARALMKIADLHLTRFNKSREIEWQVNALLWTAILAVSAFLYEKVSSANLFFLSWNKTCFFMMGAFVWLANFGWLYKIQQDQELDRQAYLKCRDRALELLGEFNHVQRIPENVLRPRGLRWILVACVVTQTLLGGTLFLLHAKFQIMEPCCASKFVVTRPIVASPAPVLSEYAPGIYPLKLSVSETLLGSSALDLDILDGI